MSTYKSRRIGRRFLPFLLFAAFCMLLLKPALPAQAARTTGTVKNAVLNVRTSASTSSSIVCKLSQGTKVTILSETTGDDGMKWYNVYFAYNNEAKEGYVRADLIKVASSTSTSSSGSSSSSSSSSSSGTSTAGSGTKYIKPSVALVRSYASTNGDIRSRLSKGTSVTVLSSKTGPDDGKTWYKISYQQNGATLQGYVRGDLLVDSTTSTSSGTSSSSGTRYINGTIVRVRTYASTSADIRSRLSQGTAVTVISSKNGDDGNVWYKIAYKENGTAKNGYVRSDMLTDGSTSGNNSSSSSSSGNSSGSSSSSSSSSGSTTNASATIKPTVANIRSYASVNGDIRSKLSQGTTVTILSEKTGDDSQKWYKISYTYNGSTMTGYIRSDLVTLSGSSSGSSSSSSSSSSNSGNSSSGVAKVRSYASPYADVRATLENGTKVTILKEKTGEDGQLWTKISFTQNGQKMEGYIPSSLLK